jgi:hypothetical protein
MISPLDNSRDSIERTVVSLYVLLRLDTVIMSGKL